MARKKLVADNADYVPKQIDFLTPDGRVKSEYKQHKLVRVSRDVFAHDVLCNVYTRPKFIYEDRVIKLVLLYGYNGDGFYLPFRSVKRCREYVLKLENGRARRLFCVQSLLQIIIDENDVSKGGR